ncbi:MAG: hypothetical protein B1H04_01050 [Planctomycetales bacterium 4484_123]|nr:MAG: hypothetical protein B1H04_01050 [Planctomycetales bacterium 4484_123]
MCSDACAGPLPAFRPARCRNCPFPRCLRWSALAAWWPPTGTNGESSRLVRTVKRRQRLVTAVGSSSWTPAWGRGQFTINFRCRPELASKAEAAIIAELRRVVREGVTAEELARAKRQKVADFVYSQQTVESQAGTLASDYLSTGDVGSTRSASDGSRWRRSRPSPPGTSTSMPW